MLQHSEYLGTVEITNSEESDWLLVYDNTRRLCRSLDELGAAAYADKFGTRPLGVKL